MNIAHFYANKENLGDFGSAFQARKFIDQSSPFTNTYFDFFFRDEVSTKTVDFISKNCDLILIGGGGLLSNSPTLRKWLISFGRQLPNIKKHEIPYFVYSVGFNEEYANPKRWKLDKRTISCIRQIYKNAQLSSVRDKWSQQQLLQKTGILSPVIPCPASTVLSPKQEEMNSIGINLVPESRIRNKKLFKQKMANLLVWIKEGGWEIRYISHSGKTEDSILSMNNIVQGEIVKSSTPDILVANYSKNLLNITMRAHAMLFSLSAKKPSINLAYNKKCLSFSQEIGPGSIALDTDTHTDIIKKEILFMLKNRHLLSLSLSKRKEEFIVVNKCFSRKIISSIRELPKIEG